MNQEVTLGADADQPRVVPAEPAAAEDQVGPAQQRQHAAVGAAVRDELRREEQGDVPRELLAEEQARGGEGQDRGAVRLGHPGGPATQGRGRRAGQPVPSAGRRGAHGRRGVHRRQRRRSRPATTCCAWTSRTARSIDMYARHAVLRRRPTRGRTTTPAGRSSSMRNVKATEGRRQERARSADVAAGRRRARARGHRRATAPCSSSITRPTTRW